MDYQPFPSSRVEMEQSLVDFEFDPQLASHLSAQARPAIILSTVAGSDDTIPLGSSKLGGRPDLPYGTQWPTRPAYPDSDTRASRHRKKAASLIEDAQKPRAWLTPEKAEKFSAERLAKADAIERSFPLAFFGQVDLESLSQEQGFNELLPKEGRLLVFYDFWEQPEDFTPEASVGWQVLWDTTPKSELSRLPLPEELVSISNDKWSSVFNPAIVEAESVFTPIPLSDAAWNAFSFDDDEAVEDYQYWIAEFGRPDTEGRDNFQLGGFPQPLQNSLQATSQLAANGINCGRSEAWGSDKALELLKDVGDWQLVLQIGADAKAGIPAPGAYYVIMREQDIIARRFDKARVVYQCD